MRKVQIDFQAFRQTKTDKCLLVRFCFSILNNRDLNESVKKTTRCVVFSG